MELSEVLALLLPGLMIGGIYALIAVGLNLVYGTMRVLNIAHGELMMIGAYISFWFFTLYGISPLISLAIVVVLSSLLGLAVCQIIFLPMMRSTRSLELLESNSLLIFFGLSIIFTNIASLWWSADIRGYSYLTRVIEIWGVPLMLNRLTAFGLALAVSLGCFALLQKSLFGTAVRALIQDRDASQLVGINPNKVYIFSFALGFAMAGLAGALISMFYEISPFMGLPYTVTAFVVIVLGGLGNILGSLLGGLILGLVETIGVTLTSPGFRSIISYAIFIAVLLLRPRGIFGKGV